MPEKLAVIALMAITLAMPAHAQHWRSNGWNGGWHHHDGNGWWAAPLALGLGLGLLGAYAAPYYAPPAYYPPPYPYAYTPPYPYSYGYVPYGYR